MVVLPVTPCTFTARKFRGSVVWASCRDTIDWSLPKVFLHRPMYWHCMYNIGRITSIVLVHHLKYSAVRAVSCGSLR